MKLVDLVPLKEDLSRADIEELEALARQAQDIQDSEAGYAQQQGDFDSDKFGNEFADEKVMPYGGEYYSMNDIQAAIDNYYDRMPGRSSVPLTYGQATGQEPLPDGTYLDKDGNKTTVAPNKAAFTKSSKFDRMNEAKIKTKEEFDKRASAEQKAMEKKWDSLVTTIAFKKEDPKQHAANMEAKLEYLKDLNNAGKLKKEYSDDKLENWSIESSLFGWDIASTVLKTPKPTNEDHTRTKAYSAVEVTKSMWDKMDSDARMDALLTVYSDPNDAEKYVDRKFEDLPEKGTMTVDEGTCGYGPNGIPGKTPGETRGMPADDRTNDMLRLFIQKEISKLKEGSFDDRLKSMMGKDDFEKATSKDVPGMGDTVIDDKTNITFGKKMFTKMMTQFTDEPFLIETGLKLYDAWARGEGGLKPSRILKILQDTSN